jgi:pimeloyl-ACP methyl ester carboxylesterase
MEIMTRRDFLLGIAFGAVLYKNCAVALRAASQGSLLRTGTARTSLGDAYFELHGNPRGGRVFMAGPVFSRTPNPANVALQTQIKEGYISRLGDRYQLVMSDYPHIATNAPADPKLLTVENVCADYLAIADAAGLQTFAAAGYSWGGNTVLQLATRSKRVSALVVGGWPAIGGPYQELLHETEELQKKSPDRPEIGRYVNYYRSLQTWPERAEVAKLKCPRMNFVDTGDDEFIDPFRGNKKLLHELGWETFEVKSGSGHPGGLMPEIACPVIRAFLDEHLV